MKRLSIAKLLSGTVYGVGVLVVVCLLVLCASQNHFVPAPNAMLPMTLSEAAFGWLALGTGPMLLSCLAVYRCWNIAESAHPKRNFCLVFLPSFLCAACLLFILGLFTVGNLFHSIFHTV